jgi:hypothetical protein
LAQVQEYFELYFGEAQEKPTPPFPGYLIFRADLTSLSRRSRQYRRALTLATIWTSQDAQDLDLADFSYKQRASS